MGRSSISQSRLRVLLATLVLAFSLLGVSMSIAMPADAQQVSCERVSYNEVITLVCESSDTGSSGGDPGAGSSDAEPSGDDTETDAVGDAGSSGGDPGAGSSGGESNGDDSDANAVDQAETDSAGDGSNSSDTEVGGSDDSGSRGQAGQQTEDLASDDDGEPGAGDDDVIVDDTDVESASPGPDGEDADAALGRTVVATASDSGRSDGLVAAAAIALAAFGGAFLMAARRCNQRIEI